MDLLVGISRVEVPLIGNTAYQWKAPLVGDQRQLMAGYNRMAYWFSAGGVVGGVGIARLEPELFLCKLEDTGNPGGFFAL